MIDEGTKRHALTTKIYTAVWHTDLELASLWQKVLIKCLRILYAVVRDLADGQLSLRAMSLVYTTVISLVPLLALSFSVLKGFGVHNQIGPMLLNTLEPLGDKRIEITEQIIGFVDNIKVGVLGVLGLALLVYSVIAMMQKIECSFNYTWQIDKGRTFAQRFSDYLSVVLVGPLLIFLSIGIAATIRTHTVVEYLASTPFFGELLQLLGLIVPYLIMATAFTFIYVFVPNTRVHIKSAFVGGLVTAVIWKTMGLVFATFIANSANNTAIYSAFASAIIFMVWIYLGWLVLLIGASIAFYHQNPQNILTRKDQFRLSHRQEEQLLLTISFLVAKNFHESANPWTEAHLSAHLKLPIEVIKNAILQLKKIGFLIQSNEFPPTYHPVQPIESSKVQELLQAICCIDERAFGSVAIIAMDKPVEKYFATVDRILCEQLGQVTFKTFVENKNEELGSINLKS